MLLLKTAEAAESRTTLVFGAGLIGGRIAQGLVNQGWTAERLPLSWEDRLDQAAQLEALGRHLEQLRPVRLHVLWSAGRGGFLSSEGDLALEVGSFRAVLRFCESLEPALRRRLTFHLMSSLGGLFEGQRHIDAASRPDPQRPYGHAKLAQERALLESPAEFPRRIYRLASVFGPGSPKSRRGLIPTILFNTRAGETTIIVGHLTTLRDYVFTEDIARFFSKHVSSPSFEEPWTGVLASGKPTSIHEVLRGIERATRRRPLIRFAAERVNPMHITVDPSLFPGAWEPTDLDTAIRSLCRSEQFDLPPPRI